MTEKMYDCHHGLILILRDQKIIAKSNIYILLKK